MVEQEDDDVHDNNDNKNINEAEQGDVMSKEVERKRCKWLKTCNVQRMRRSIR